MLDTVRKVLGTLAERREANAGSYAELVSLLQRGDKAPPVETIARILHDARKTDVDLLRDVELEEQRAEWRAAFAKGAHAQSEISALNVQRDALVEKYKREAHALRVRHDAEIAKIDAQSGVLNNLAMAAQNARNKLLENPSIADAARLHAARAKHNRKFAELRAADAKLTSYKAAGRPTAHVFAELESTVRQLKSECDREAAELERVEAETLA